MHLWFEFDDFFRNQGEGEEARSDIRTPTFLVQRGVIGGVTIKDLNDSLLNNEHARMEIDLEGFMRIELDSSDTSRSEFRVTMEKKTLSMVQAFSIRGHIYNASSNERHYPFSFNLQSWLRHDQQTNLNHHAMASRNSFASIPPSLRHEIATIPQGLPKPRAGARITYKLTARLLEDRRMIEQIVQPIWLLLSQTPPPPICIADFEGEYRPSQQSVLRGVLFQKIGNITVTAQEPKHLTVRADCAESMVELPVKLLLARSKQGPSVPGWLCLEAEVKWQFRLLTFVSLLEQRGPPTLKQALASPTTAFVRSSLGIRSLTMVWRNWSKINETGNFSLVESEQSLWLTLPRFEILTSTFWSPYVSRRYSIWLQLKVTEPGTASLEVEVPVQVTVEPTASDAPETGLRSTTWGNGSSVFESAEEDEVLPQYEYLG